ncbi:hypothetical protein WJ68_04645 [Burkholderia ubonensis]|uniref:DUF4158 domain-containing protein n=1 Tax=Burkholderia ubonensis TaxID=101571 RepID=A0ABD4E5I9_9BURK|nr:hypothetical protein WJ68_04645 [Burkholderia ubonensis]
MMDHWRLAYLGMRHFPHELTEFELNTFFTFSARERALIDGRRSHLYRLAVGLHLGFVRMTGRTLGAYKQIPKRRWHHLGEQLGVEPPDLGTLRALYDDRTDRLPITRSLPTRRSAFARWPSINDAMWCAGARLASGSRMRRLGGTTSSWAIMRCCKFFNEPS